MHILHDFNPHIVDLVVALLKASFCSQGGRAKVQYNNKLDTYDWVVYG